MALTNEEKIQLIADEFEVERYLNKIWHKLFTLVMLTVIGITSAVLIGAKEEDRPLIYGAGFCGGLIFAAMISHITDIKEHQEELQELDYRMARLRAKRDSELALDTREKPDVERDSA